MVSLVLEVMPILHLLCSLKHAQFSGSSTRNPVVCGNDKCSEAVQALTAAQNHWRSNASERLGFGACRQRRGIVFGIGDATTGHGEAYAGRYKKAGGLAQYYFKELTASIRSVKRVAPTLPIALVVHGRFKLRARKARASAAAGDQPKDSAFDFDFIDCVIESTLPDSAGLGTEQVTAVLQSPWEESIYLDADVRACADPAPVFDLLQAHDIGMTTEFDAGLQKRHDPTHLYDAANPRVLAELNMGVVYVRRSPAALDAFLHVYERQLSGDPMAAQPLLWKYLASRQAAARVKQLPAEFNLRQNMFARDGVLVRGPVVLAHSRLLTDQDRIDPVERSDPRAVSLQAAVNAAGGFCMWLNDRIGSRVIDISVPAVTLLKDLRHPPRSARSGSVGVRIDVGVQTNDTIFAVSSWCNGAKWPLEMPNVTSETVRACLGRSNPLTRTSCDPSRMLTHAKQQHLAVALLAAGRPHYLAPVLESLANQSGEPFDTVVYLDLVPGQKQKAMRTRQAMVSLVADALPRARLVLPPRHLGVAKLSWLAQQSTFSGGYDSLLLLEEDHLIGHTYVQAIRLLLQASEADSEVGPVNGNFINMPAHLERVHRAGRPPLMMERDDGCTFQKAPLDALVELHSHNVWAWGVSRSKWERMAHLFERAFAQSGLETTEYAQRNFAQIRAAMKPLCPGTGFNRWAGQDWLRACAFHAAGMPYKLQPTTRLMSYIGMHGTHYNLDAQNFSALFSATTAMAVTRSLSSWPVELCSGAVCVMRRAQSPQAGAERKRLHMAALGDKSNVRAP